MKGSLDPITTYALQNDTAEPYQSLHYNNGCGGGKNRLLFKNVIAANRQIFNIVGSNRSLNALKACFKTFTG